MDRLVAYIDGQAYDRFASIQVTRTIESIADSFSLSLGSVPVGDGRRSVLPFHRGSRIVLEINGEPILTGYVNQVDASDDASRATINIAGRSLAGDVVDSSAEYRKWKKHGVLTIAKQIAEPYGVDVISPIPADPAVATPLDRFGIEEGERAMEAIERLAKLRGLLVASSPYGQLVLQQAGTATYRDTIRRGVNIESASYAEDESEQYSKYIVKGQSAGRDTFFGEESAHNVATATDESVSRFRPMVIVSETKATAQDLQHRAEWERNTRAGRTISYSAVVLGWHTPSGRQLWQENRLVPVFDPLYGIRKSTGGPLLMLITGVTYHRSLGSPDTKTSIKLALPQAYQPLLPPSKGGDSPWD